MKRPIDLATWNRREHFRFFSAFDDPFFGITAQVDFTDLYEKTRAEHRSFFLCSTHHLLCAANATEAFRLRAEENNVVCYDRVHLSPTIGRDDGTFGFGFFAFDPDLDRYVAGAEAEIARVCAADGLSASPHTGRTDLIRYSSLPWFAFSEMKHAASFRTGDSVPRISTGRLVRERGRWLLPVSVCVHHGLMDGRHVAEFLERTARFPL